SELERRKGGQELLLYVGQSSTSGIPEVRKLLLYHDEEATPVSDLMGRENHIFGVVPKVDVEAELDWRMPVFEAGKYVIAFDGAALLLLEVWRRRKRLV